MVEKVRRSAQWTTPASVAESIKAMRSAVALHGARIEQTDDNTFTAHFGSKLTYRLWGAFLKRGAKALPFKVAVTTTTSAQGGANITAEGESDEGPGILYRIELATRLLDERISDVLSVLRAHSGLIG